MATLFADVDVADVILALAAGAGLMALINFTAFGGRKAASIAR
ncbi:hypothetical protein QFW80_04155 [Luteimonas sp. M1R5S18]|uniref:Uncharacterized protein n=1 Tax=Luteimonas rhizosphaericola TaxID=3042024 RepID=A0ABT6JI17_9GAMM|nr:hypothetical protein [Luteimonas rhizosphaericola]MDH5829711.1 hypothetical protein [Luteimonas rhizosphaericola]